MTRPKPALAKIEYKLITAEQVHAHGQREKARVEAVLDAMRLALDTYDNITTEEFANGADKRARHAMRQALSEYEQEAPHEV